MNVFLTGASGYVGRHVALELLSRGHEVVGLARASSPRTKYSDDVVWCYADLAAFESYRPILESCDAVIHCAMDYSQGSENSELDATFIARFRGSKQHFVYTGNLFATRSAGVSSLEEASDLDPGSSWRFKNENLVLQTLNDAAILRPGFVYGSNGGYLWHILSAGTVFNMNQDAIPEAYWPMVHVKDVAALYATIVESRATGVFHAWDGETNLARDIIEQVKAVYSAHGKSDLEAHDYVSGLLKMSIRTSNDHSLSIGWNPTYAAFSDEAESAFKEYDGE